MSLTLPVRESIELKTFEPSDADMLFEVTRTNNVHLRQWLGWLDDDASVEDTKKYLVESVERLEHKEGLDLGVFENGQLIGGIGLFPWDAANKKTSIAYWLTEEAQGKGIMTAALEVVIEYAFSTMGIHRIEITCALENTRSSALPKKLGFIFEGIAREGSWLYDHFVDLEVYSLLSNEWKK